MTHRTPFVGGNWKANGSLATSTDLAAKVADGARTATKACEIAVFPPFPYLLAVGAVLRDRGSAVMLGAQDLWHGGQGAYTGEVAASMLVDCGVRVVLAGHSERRHVIGEPDDLVRDKVRAAIEAGLHVILCVGETLEQREAGQTDAVNDRQVRSGLGGLNATQMKQVTIAYEPVWAIGTGRTATPGDAQSAHAAIRRVVAEAVDAPSAAAVRIQYGGSVKPGNAAELFAQPDIDGGLIGGASLKSEDFCGIVAAAR